MSRARRATRRTPLFPLLLVCALVVAMLLPLRAGAVERNFAGSVQLDYHFVPTQPAATL